MPDKTDKPTAPDAAAPPAVPPAYECGPDVAGISKLHAEIQQARQAAKGIKPAKSAPAPAPAK